MDVLNFKPKNILPDELIDQLSEYWCDSDDTRDENLGQFIQRVAEIGQWWPPPNQEVATETEYRICERCGVKNSPSNLECFRCGAPR